jgi:inorganic pyrophosphatase
MKTTTSVATPDERIPWAPKTLASRRNSIGNIIERDGQPLSPFHDVPLYANEQQMVLNMIVAGPIPTWRWSSHVHNSPGNDGALTSRYRQTGLKLTWRSIQISKEEFLNPIKQDIKKGKLRFVRNCFPHKVSGTTVPSLA